MYIKLIWMIADKLYSNVSLFISTSYIMVLLHNFLYIQKIFLGQKLDLFTIINYISLFYSIWMRWKADVLLCLASTRNQYWFIFSSFRSVIFVLFVCILGMCFVKSFQLFGSKSSRRILSHMKVTKSIGEPIDVVLQHTVYNLMLSI